jgi:hypothetical protein
MDKAEFQKKKRLACLDKKKYRKIPFEPGQVFYWTTVIELLEGRRHSDMVYICRCSCGALRKVSHEALKAGVAKSCKPCAHKRQSERNELRRNSPEWQARPQAKNKSYSKTLATIESNKKYRQEHREIIAKKARIYREKKARERALFEAEKERLKAQGAWELEALKYYSNE